MTARHGATTLRTAMQPGRATGLVATVATMVVALLATLAVPVAADDSARTETSGPRSMTVSQTRDLDPAGTLVDVQGAGYDTTPGRGIYVAFCAVPQPGQIPSPCGGTPGQAGSSMTWVGTDEYATANEGQLFGPGGTFSTQILVQPMIGTLDCRQVRCAVVSRSDHRNIADRSQDVIVPISFAGTDAATLPLAASPNVGTDATTQVSSRIDPVAKKPRPRLPVTVESADGRTVEVTDVSRVVSLTGSLSEILYTLGLGDRLVGRDISATFKEARDVPLVTRAHDVSAESVLSRRPTLVLAQTDSGPPDALEHIRNAGVPVVVFAPPTSVAEIGERESAVAEALGVPKVGAKLQKRTQAELKAIRARVPAGANRPRVAFLYMRGPAGVYLIGGKGSGADSMIEAAGGIDAGTAMGLDKAFTPITSEALAKAAPDVILMTTTGLESVGGIEGLVKIPGIAQTPAGKQRRVVTEEDGLLFSFGSRTPVALKRLVDKLHEVEASKG